MTQPELVAKLNNAWLNTSLEAFTLEGNGYSIDFSLDFRGLHCYACDGSFYLVTDWQQITNIACDAWQYVNEVKHKGLLERLVKAIGIE